MEKFNCLSLFQVFARKAFLRGDDYFLIKKNEEIRMKIELTNPVCKIAIFIVQDNEEYRNKLVRSDPDTPAFSICYPAEFTCETIRLDEFNNVLAYSTHVEPTTHGIELRIIFNELSSATINCGEKHDARQWNLVFLTKSNNESLWHNLVELPIQVVSEVTGVARLPQERKRPKRTYMKGSIYLQKNKRAKTSKDTTTSRRSSHEVKLEDYHSTRIHMYSIYLYKKIWKIRYDTEFNNRKIKLEDYRSTRIHMYSMYSYKEIWKIRYDTEFKNRKIKAMEEKIKVLHN